MNDDVIGKL